jgi:HEAT repeat protein
MTIQMLAAFISGTVLVVLLFSLGVYILVRGDQRPIPPLATFIFRVVLSLAGAAFAAILPGFLNIQVKVLSIAIQAGGALAVFVVIYRINPPELLAHQVKKEPSERKVKSLINDLKRGSERDRRKAALALSNVGEAARIALPDLIESLNDADPFVREYSAQALEQLGSPAVRTLIVALRHAKGLAVAGPTPMIARPIPQLKEVMGEADVRACLIEIGAPAVPALIEALREATPAIQPFIGAALAKIQGGNPSSIVDDALSSSDDDIRLNGAVALAENASPSDVPTLAALLKDRLNKVRVCGFSGLAKSGSKNAVGPFVDAFKLEADSNVRVAAITGLGQLGLKVDEAIPPLIELLSDQSLSVQMGSILALGEIGARAKAAVPGLAAFLENENWHWRQQAAIALGKISSREAVPVLSEALKDQEERVRQAAAEALKEIQEN